MKYWNQAGKYQDEYNQLFTSLVPSMGECETVGGEVIRAVSKIYYDAFNNGFCNNTSGPLNYLEDVLDYKDFACVYNVLRFYVNTGGYVNINEDIQEALDKMVDLAVEFNINNPEKALDVNDVDMLDYTDPDPVYDEEEEYYY